MLINTITTGMKYKNWRFLTCKFLFAAARPSPGGVFTQFVMSKVGALQQKIPGVSTPQPLTGPQKFSIRPSPVMVVTPVVSSEPVQVCSPVTAAVTTTTPQVFLENVTTVTPMTAISDVAASRKPRTLLPSTSNSKATSSSGTTTNRPGKNLKAFVPAKRPIGKLNCICVLERAVIWGWASGCRYGGCKN